MENKIKQIKKDICDKICDSIIAEMNADLSIAEDYFKVLNIINKVRENIYNDN